MKKKTRFGGLCPCSRLQSKSAYLKVIDLAVVKIFSADFRSLDPDPDLDDYGMSILGL